MSANMYPRPSLTRAEWHLARHEFQHAAWEFFRAGDTRRGEDTTSILASTLSSKPIRVEAVPRSKGIKQKWLLEFESGDKALFKPGIQQLKPYEKDPEREEAVYRIDRLLGVHATPYTLVRDVDVGNKGTPLRGSVMYWIKDAFHPRFAGLTHDDRPDSLRFFDAVIGNEDRHEDQWLVLPSGVVVAVDHDHTFRHDRNAQVLNVPIWERELRSIADLTTVRGLSEQLSRFDEPTLREACRCLDNDDVQRFLDTKTKILQWIDSRVK